MKLPDPNIPNVDPLTQRLVTDIRSAVVDQLQRLSYEGRPLGLNLCCVALLDLVRCITDLNSSSQDISGLEIMAERNLQVMRAIERRSSRMAYLARIDKSQMWTA